MSGYQYGASTQRGTAGVHNAQAILNNLKREIQELRKLQRLAAAEVEAAQQKARDAKQAAADAKAQAEHEAKQAQQDAQMIIRKHNNKVLHTINKKTFDAAEAERLKALQMFPEPDWQGTARLMEATAEIDDHNLRMRAIGLQRHLASVA